jgi:hypothetical protein
MSSRGPWYHLEETVAGLQHVMPGVAPITQADRIKQRSGAPLTSKKPQQPCDLGLFDNEARAQLDLVELCRKP